MQTRDDMEDLVRVWQETLDKLEEQPSAALQEQIRAVRATLRRLRSQRTATDGEFN